MPHEVGRATVGMVAGLSLSVWLALSTHSQIAALDEAPLLTPADVVAVVIVALGAVLAAWHGLTYGAVMTLHCLHRARLRPRSRLQHAGGADQRRVTERRLSTGLLRWGFPLARRAILGAAMAGTGAGLAALPAHATAAVGEDLGWGAMAAEAEENAHGTGTAAETTPEQSTEETAHQGSDDATPETPATETQASEPPAAQAVHEVQPGESLWSIAAAHLDDRATDAEIAAAWPQWYEANHALIGADPDLIHPGLELDAPATHVTEEQS